MSLQPEIDFLSLSSSRFEELCLDLLGELGFRKLVWRQGGADDGRDIEGKRFVDTGLMEAFEEVWFFECKRYKNGVPPAELISKIAWADAEKPQHLVFLISSYLSPRARDWLSKIRADKQYQIHVVEGKRLQNLVSCSSDLMSRYFSTSAMKLMDEARRAWLFHNLIPEPELLRTLADVAYLDDYSDSQLAFLWAALKIRLIEVLANMDDSFAESYDIIFTILKRKANSAQPVLESHPDFYLIQDLEQPSYADVIYNKVYAAELVIESGRTKCLALYCLVRDSEGEGLEVLVYQNSDLTCQIRHISTGARRELDAVKLVVSKT